MNDDYIENLLSKYGRNKPVRQGVDQSAEKGACYVAADMIRSLQAQLAESQRREQAAANLINRLGKDINTISRATEYIKPGTGVWHTVGIMFQAIENWRGQRKGDAD